MDGAQPCWALVLVAKRCAFWRSVWQNRVMDAQGAPAQHSTRVSHSQAVAGDAVPAGIKDLATLDLMIWRQTKHQTDIVANPDIQGLGALIFKG
jgi:hypothetical protein